MKFFDVLRPEERIVLHAEKIAEMGTLSQFRVKPVVAENLVAEGELV
jgi:hypothetical protein